MGIGVRWTRVLVVAVSVAVILVGAGCSSTEPVESAEPTEANESAESPPGDSEQPPSATEVEEPESSVAWDYDAAAWSDDLLAAAKGFVEANAAFDAMALSDPEVAVAADGSTWAVFRVSPEVENYESAYVLMKREAGGVWEGVDLGTGGARADFLPDDLLDSDFAVGYLEDY